MISKFFLLSSRADGNHWGEDSAENFGDFKYTNKIYNDYEPFGQVVPLSWNYRTNAALGSSLIFDTRYPLSNLVGSNNIDKETRITDYHNDPGQGYLSGITVGLSYDSFNSVVLQFNKLRNTLAANSITTMNTRYIYIAIRNGTALEYGFRFKCNFDDGVPASTIGDIVTIGGNKFLNTNSWSPKEGIILLDKELFSLYNKVANSDATPWDSFTEFADTGNWYLDIWFANDSLASTPDPFHLANIFAGHSFDFYPDEKVSQEIDSLSKVSRSVATGITFIEKNSTIKKLALSITSMDRKEYFNYSKNIADRARDQPLFFFPWCEANFGNNSFNANTEKEFQHSNLNLGGLFLFKEIPFTSDRYDVFSTEIKLEEYK